MYNSKELSSSVVQNKKNFFCTKFFEILEKD